jgi:ABC-type nickel/cobalt efflux system permease component RcnA
VYKKLLIVLLLIIPLAFLKPTKVFADPVDITDSYFYFDKEVDNSQMNEKQINMYAYINWLQAAILVDHANGKKITDIEELLKYQDIYDEYVKNNIKVSNNGQLCTVTIDKSPVTEDQISLSLGTRVIATFICPAKIENAKIESNLFLKDFPTESNNVWISHGEDTLHAVTLGTQTPSYEFNAQDLINHPKGDETHLNSANLSANQITENLPGELQVVANTKINTNTGSNGSVGNPSQDVQATSESTEAATPTKTSGPGPKKVGFIAGLTDALYLKTNAIKDQSLPFLLLLVFCLGFLHTIEAGHSKTILASSMINNRMNLKKGLGYATIFTITHLGDIIIVGLILLAADQYYDFLGNFTMIEKFAGYALFFMSIYLLFQSARFYFQKWITKNNNLEMPGHIHVENTDIKFRDQLTLGFLAGLAPCVFGWSIFMLILSTNKIWTLVPAILCFGLGIFFALAIVVFLMSHLQKGTYSRFEKIAELSPLISAVVLLIYSLLLIT